MSLSLPARPNDSFSFSQYPVEHGAVPNAFNMFLTIDSVDLFSFALRKDFFREDCIFALRNDGIILSMPCGNLNLSAGSFESGNEVV